MLRSLRYMLCRNAPTTSAHLLANFQKRETRRVFHPWADKRLVKQRLVAKKLVDRSAVVQRKKNRLLAKLGVEIYTKTAILSVNTEIDENFLVFHNHIFVSEDKKFRQLDFAFSQLILYVCYKSSNKLPHLHIVPKNHSCVMRADNEMPRKLLIVGGIEMGDVRSLHAKTKIAEKLVHELAQVFLKRLHAHVTVQVGVPPLVELDVEVEVCWRAFPDQLIHMRNFSASKSFLNDPPQFCLACHKEFSLSFVVLFLPENK
mmetsp:Transcript_30505/g.68899  ORF Transcript_30505/g.68899 Transcript_30505/m.68899 type:complete len:259 (-) Transcript_30505:315-1091(-)